MSNDIAAIQIQVLPILKSAGVRRAAIFGSTARGEATEASDVDILVDLPDEASLLDFVGLKLDLEEKLGKKVDIVEYGALKPRLRDRILSEQVPIL